MVTDANDLSGQVLLDKFRVVRKLGGGGMGAVYEVIHLLTEHRRALKVVNSKYVKRPNYLKRLIREASVAGRLRTPFVVETYDAGSLDDGSAYVLMELLEGETLLQRIERERRISPVRVAAIMVQVCEGVAVAHRAGIVHRDLKPENIFLARDEHNQERVKILDFGISKFKDMKDEATRLTAEGTILGTPFYMSPEQAAGKAIDERTDVYAIGVMAFEAITGRLPFEASSMGALFIKIAAGEHVPLRHHVADIDPGLEDVVHRAMHKEREIRYESVEALRRALLPFAGGATVMRTKTISDGVPASADYPFEIPRAPAVPSDALPKLSTPRPLPVVPEDDVSAGDGASVPAHTKTSVEQPRYRVRPSGDAVDAEEETKGGPADRASVQQAVASAVAAARPPEPSLELPKSSRRSVAIAAVAIAVAGLAAVVAVLSSGGDAGTADDRIETASNQPPRGDRAPDQRQTSDTDDALLVPPPRLGPPDAGVAGDPVAEQRPRTKVRVVRGDPAGEPGETRTPAEAAGLDRNPYR